MKKEITVGQLLTACVSVIIAIVSGFIALTRDYSRENSIQNSRIQTLETQMKIFERFESKLDKVADALGNVQIELQNKQNRQ